ncbi:MAG: glutamyl-tRNA reductase [Rickettsiales bacterium]|nr:glutamyl-tRNA reductase [Rickettsiales bacterium]
MYSNFRAIGISYKNTPLEVREAVAFDENQTKKFLVQIKEVLGVEEALLLSTCNRTEIYFVAPEDVSSQLAAFVDVFHGLTTNNPSAPHFVKMSQTKATRHLFNVSLGLESMVLGDIQITNQVKKAYQWSADEQMAGPFLHRLLHTIFYTNKRMVQETSFRDGNASVASAAVNVVEKFTQTFTHPKIAVVGLGEIGENVVENLKGIDAEITLVNRTQEKAENLAAEFGFNVDSLDNLKEIVRGSHIIISAVQAAEPIITGDLLAGNHHPKMLIDLSVPRSIDEKVESVSGVLLYNVDQLQERASKALEERKSVIPEVSRIVDESLVEFSNWSQEMEVSPTIKKLKQALEDIRQQEMARYVGKLSDKEAKILEKATKGMIQKVIKLPVLQLKAACKRGEAETLVGVLNDLFNLEEEKSQSPN